MSQNLASKNLAPNPRAFINTLTPIKAPKALATLCMSAAALVCSGCVSLKVSTPKQHYYTLESSTAMNARIQSRPNTEPKDLCQSLSPLRLELEIPSYLNTQQILLHTTSGRLTPLPDTRLVGLPAELLSQALQARATCVLLNPFATTPLTLRVKLVDMGIIEREKIAFVSVEYVFLRAQEIVESKRFTITNDVLKDGRENDGAGWNAHGQILALQGAIDHALDSIIRHMQQDMKTYKPKK